MDSLVKIMDQKQKTGKFQAFAYPEKSTCGGALTGFYEEDQLVMTKAKNSGEAGYTDRLIYWNGNHIIKMILLEHTPDMDEYFDKYPLEKFEFDMDKLTYHDKRYEITLGTKPKIEISLDGRKLSNQVDSNLVNNLIDCGIFMKAELEMEKVPKVESR